MTVTVDALAEYMGITTSDSRYSQLFDVLKTAQERVDVMVGEQSSMVVRVVQPSGRNLVLPALRLQSVESISDPAGTSVGVTDCTINLEAGIVVLPSAPVVAGGYTVTYTTRALYAAAEAVKIIASQLWETRRGRVGARADTFAGGDMVDTRYGFAIPRRADDLLAPFTVPGFA